MPQIQSAEKGLGRNKKKGRKQERERKQKKGSFYYVNIHHEVYSPQPRKERAPYPIRLSFWLQISNIYDNEKQVSITYKQPCLRDFIKEAQTDWDFGIIQRGIYAFN